MTATFAVVIPTHDRRERLLQALESVRRQTRAPEQILVVADGCTDGSVEAVRALGDDRVEVLDLPKAPRKGWGLRNLALDRVTADVVTYLGDDDLYLPDHLERVGELHDTGRFDVVQAMTVLVWPDGRLEPNAMDWNVPWLRERFLSGAAQRNGMASVSHRAGVAERAGGWNPDPPPGVPGDVDLFKRVVRSGAVSVQLSEPTVLLISHRQGEPEDRTRQARELLERSSTRHGLALLRAQIAAEGNRVQALREEAELELYRLRDEHAALHERAGRFMAERDAAWAQLARLRG